MIEEGLICSSCFISSLEFPLNAFGEYVFCKLKKYAFGRKKVQFLVPGVHYDFFLKAIFERFSSRNNAVPSRNRLYTCSESKGIASTKSKTTLQQVHNNSFSDIISIVSCDNFVSFQLDSSSAVKMSLLFQSLSSEDSTVGAVIFETYLGHHIVHSPIIEISVGENSQRKTVDLSVLFDSLKRVISVPCFRRDSPRMPSSIESS